MSALNAVRSSGLSCQYEVPKTMGDGGQIDYYSVNVQFTSGNGTGDHRRQREGSRGLQRHQGRLVLRRGPGERRDAADDLDLRHLLRADEGRPAGRIDVLLGCKTVIIVD